jgi:hypothetical protein
MPYDTIEQAEKTNPGLKKYSDKAKRGWLSSFNSCMGSGGPESKCFAVAYSVANKVDGKKAAEEPIDHYRVFHELLIAAVDIQDVEPKLAMSLVEEAKALRMKGLVMDMMDDVKHFRGSLNKFMKEMMLSVQNPKSLSKFSELKDIIELNDFIRKKILRHTFLSPRDVSEKMQDVVEADAVA